MKYLLVCASLAALWWLHRRRHRNWWEFSPDQWERLRARWRNEDREEDRNINDPHKWGIWRTETRPRRATDEPGVKEGW